MKYIKKVTLENFQSHKYTQMEFGPELNIIVGPSDSGKSAIIRALKWVMYNEPSGDFFIREGEKECTVTLELSDGTSLQRYRTRSKNGYRLIDNNGNESIFEGIGTTVPQEIIDSTGIRKIKLDADSDNAINLGEQLEGAFLLTEKASTRANAIGRLVGVDIVDDALRDVLRDIRALNQSRKQKEETLSSTSVKLSQFQYIEDMKEIQLKVSQLMGNIHDLNIRLEKLEQINKRLYILSSEKSEIEAMLKGLDRLENVSTVFDRAEIKSDLLRKYNQFSSYCKTLNNNMETVDHTLKKVTKFVENSPSIPKLELMVYRLLNLEKIDSIRKISEVEMKRIGNISKMLDKIDHTSNLVNSAEVNGMKFKSLNNLKDKLTNILESKEKGRLYIGQLKPLIDNEVVLSDMEIKSNLLEKLVSQNERLNTIRNEMRGADVIIAKNNHILKDTLNKYKELLQTIEKCPYCLNDIDEGTIEHIITHHLGG